jgi:hypothetical protein
VKEAGLPVVYVNDSFDKWQSDFRKFEMLFEEGFRPEVKLKVLVLESFATKSLTWQSHFGDRKPIEHNKEALQR